MHMGAETCLNRYHQSPLTVVIPIPSSFPVGESLAKSFKLTYHDTWVTMPSASRDTMNTYGALTFYAFFFELFLFSGIDW